MSKVVKIFLRKGFSPIDQSVLQLGTSLNFDCYIQRFNGFAILIEKGTFLDEKIFEKITSNKLQVFVENTSLKDYQDYKKENTRHKNIYSLEEVDFQEQVQNVLRISQKVKSSKDFIEQLRAVYFLGRNFLKSWLDNKHENLPKEALEKIAITLREITTQNSVTLSHLKDILETRYSLETHLLNVAFFASLIASKLFLDDEKRKNLILAALLHDIGKADFDESLLDKPEKLSSEEFEEMKAHSKKSLNVVKKFGLRNPKLLLGIYEHHERLDGSGYPRGLRKHNLSPFGRILAVCDVFDALTTIKSYRGAYSTYNALTLIKDEFKEKLDKKYVLILIKLLK